MQYNQLCFCDKFCQEKILQILKKFNKAILLFYTKINNFSDHRHQQQVNRITWNTQQLKPRRNSSGQENNTEYQQDSPCCSSGCSNGIGSEGCSPETPGNSWKVKGHRMNALCI